MTFNKKYWLIDDIVKPEDANRWEDAIAALNANASASISGGNLTITSDNTPASTADYYVEFIAPADYVRTQNLVINGVNYGAGTTRDIQQNFLPNGAWKAGAPIRLRIVGSTLFLQGGGGGSKISVSITQPTEAEDLLWMDASTGLLMYRTTAGGAWIPAKGTYSV